MFIERYKIYWKTGEKQATLLRSEAKDHHFILQKLINIILSNYNMFSTLHLWEYLTILTNNNVKILNSYLLIYNYKK